MKFFKRIYWTLGIMMIGTGTLSASQAVADPVPFTLDFNESSAYEGQGVFGQPGWNYVNDVVPPEPHARASLAGTLDGGQVSIGAGELRVETSAVWNQFGLSYFKVDWSVPNGTSGTFDHASGELKLDVDLVQTVTYNGSICSVGPFPVTLSTELSSEAGSGSRFEDGIDGPGALVGRWDATPAPQGPDCDLLALQCRPRHSLLRGAGAFGLARDERLDRGATTADWKVDKFGLNAPIAAGGCADPEEPKPTCETDPDLCPAQPLPRVKLTNKSVRKGINLVRVKVRNSGPRLLNGIATCAKLSGGKVLGKRCRNVAVLKPRTTATLRFRIKVRRTSQIRPPTLSVTVSGIRSKTSTKRFPLRIKTHSGNSRFR